MIASPFDGEVPPHDLEAHADCALLVQGEDIVDYVYILDAERLDVMLDFVDDLLRLPRAVLLTVQDRRRAECALKRAASRSKDGQSPGFREVGLNTRHGEQIESRVGQIIQVRNPLPAGSRPRRAVLPIGNPRDRV
jgi:hypothetical protein